MYEFIEGNLIELNPAFAVIQTGGIAYFINISLSTYAQLEEQKTARLYLHQVVREDAILLFGFSEKKEREIFRLLISVSGIGANTARMILSSLSTSEIQNAIASENVNLIKSVKGIGLKTAQKVIIDLKDKLGKDFKFGEKVQAHNNTIKEESLSAMVMLGFAKNVAEKALDKILSENNNLTVEELIKKALKIL